MHLLAQVMPGYVVLLSDNKKLDNVTEEECSPWNIMIKRKGHINLYVGNYYRCNYISSHHANLIERHGVDLFFY